MNNVHLNLSSPVWWLLLLAKFTCYLAVPLGIRGIQDHSWSLIACARVRSWEYPRGLSAVALASGFSQESFQWSTSYLSSYRESSSRRSGHPLSFIYCFISLLLWLLWIVPRCTLLYMKVLIPLLLKWLKLLWLKYLKWDIDTFQTYLLFQTLCYCFASDY